MSDPTPWDRRLYVTSDGKNLIGHAGAVLLRKLADRTGLTRALSGTLPSSTANTWRDRATVLVHLAVAIASARAACWKPNNWVCTNSRCRAPPPRTRPPVGSWPPWTKR
ncbi:hypothetical protein [Nocardiopsis sp. CNR-923]|uniref:hypothetical protein n=1 Tax=Nocardiopsis sp. CNR-923 TaxID=1904965 RepID=UPI000B1F791D|nr:hypothetical protein [Nocardiopsis sp. CNR-923]